MKKLFTMMSAVLISATLWAQSPPKMSYQAVIRNNSSQLLTNTQVGMKISILKGLPPTYTVVYWETQTPTTNANGLVSLEIGGDWTGFDTIHWKNGPYFIKTETDPNGGTNYTITGESELLSVPFALHSKTAESVTGWINETDPVYGASPAAGITSANISNWNNGMLPAGLYGQTLRSNGTAWIPSNNLSNDGFHVDIDRLSVMSEFTTFSPILIAVPYGAPLLTSSTVKVDSLNVDFLDGKHAADFSFATHNHGTGTLSYIPKWISGSTFGNSIIYDAGTNVGIGTTSPAATFDVQNSYGVVARFVGEGAMTTLNTYVGIKDQTGGVDWYLSALNNGDFAITQGQGGGYNRILINNVTGNIAMGMGTTTNKLDVNGVIGASGGTSTQWNTAYSWGNHASAGYLTSYTETDPIFGASPAAGITGANITNWNSGLLPAGLSGQTLRHNGTNWIATSNLYNDGTRIGIGIVPDYIELFHIHGGSSQPWATASFTNTFTGSTGTDGFVIGLAAGDGDAYIWNHETASIIFGTSTTDRMIINSSGNVGIGTLVPSAQLHTTGSVRFEGAGSPGAGKILTSDALGNATWQSSSSIPAGTNGQTLRYSGTSWVANSTLFNDGTNVGIGTSNPSQKLDVSGGSIKTSGQLISTQATGTAPMAVNSTTVVGDLNADMTDGKHITSTATGSSTSAWSNTAANIATFAPTRSVTVTYAHYYNFEIITSLDWATAGGIAHIIGFENDGALIISWYATNGDGTMSWGEAKALEGSNNVLFAFGNGTSIIRVKASPALNNHTLIFETNHSFLNIKYTYR